MGKHLPRKIRIEREWKRLEQIAQERGYEHAASMLYGMYVIERIPIERIARDLYTPLWTLRKRFDELGISVRTRGGRNYVKIPDITPELVQEVSRDGVRAVSDRLGVDYGTLYVRLRTWWEVYQKGDVK